MTRALLGRASADALGRWAVDAERRNLLAGAAADEPAPLDAVRRALPLGDRMSTNEVRAAADLALRDLPPPAPRHGQRPCGRTLRLAGFGFAPLSPEAARAVADAGPRILELEEKLAQVERGAWAPPKAARARLAEAEARLARAELRRAELDHAKARLPEARRELAAASGPARAERVAEVRELARVAPWSFLGTLGVGNRLEHAALVAAAEVEALDGEARRLAVLAGAEDEKMVYLEVAGPRAAAGADWPAHGGSLVVDLGGGPRAALERRELHQSNDEKVGRHGNAGRASAVANGERRYFLAVREPIARRLAELLRDASEVSVLEPVESALRDLAAASMAFLLARPGSSYGRRSDRSPEHALSTDEARRLARAYYSPTPTPFGRVEVAPMPLDELVADMLEQTTLRALPTRDVRFRQAHDAVLAARAPTRVTPP